MLLESVIVWVVLVIRKPPTRPAHLNWISSSNIFLIVIATLIVLFLVLFNIVVTSKSAFSLKILTKIKQCYETSIGGYLIYGSLAGANLLISTCTFAIVLGVISPERLSTVFFIFINSLPLLILWFILSIKSFVLFSFILSWELYLPNLSEKITALIETKSFGLFWIFSTLILSISHWLSLIFRWPIDSLIPLWYWQTTTKSGMNSWLVIPLGILFFISYWLIVNKNIPSYAKTIIVFVIGYLLMIGFAAIEGPPYQILYDKRYISGHRNYIAVAARNEGGTQFLYDYETTLGGDRFYATKPPGVYITYRGLLAFGSLIFPHDTYQEKYDAINHSIMLLFPILALSSTIILEKMTKRLTNINPHHLPGLLLIVVPSFVLLQGTIDQAIIPLLFISGLLLGMIALQRSSWCLSILFGTFVYLSLYFSFSLIPMIMVFGLWVILEVWRNWHANDLHAHLKLALGSMIGFFLLFLLLYFTFNYSPLIRYQNAIAVHEVQRFQPVSIRNYISLYLLNNTEFFTWIGLPIAITTILAAIHSSINFLWGRWTSIESLLIAFLITYVFLNHFSKTVSEVARLWLFFVPLICIFSIDFIQVKMKKKAFISILLFCQLITMLLITQNIRITWE